MLLTSSFVIATGLSSLDPRTPRSPPIKRVMDKKKYFALLPPPKKTTHMKHLDTTAEKKSPSPSFPPRVSPLFACFYVAPFVCLSFWRRFIFGREKQSRWFLTFCHLFLLPQRLRYVFLFVCECMGRVDVVGSLPAKKGKIT